MRFWFFTLVLGGFSVFSQAYAGFFYFGADIGKIFSYDYQEPAYANFQIMPLLENTYGFESTGPRGGGEITIVNNNSLLPESGPLGTAADIEETPSGGQISVYIVREGDNLSQIAKMFNVSVNTIIWSNNINRGDSIRTGQTLVILPISGVRYEIKKGDTLNSIAKKLNGDIDEIMRFNDIYSDKELAVGQTLIVPNGEIVPTPSAKPKGKFYNPAHDTAGPYYANYYARPIIGGIKTQGLHGYNGVDLADSCGKPVLASAGGDVIISRSGAWNGGYGNYIVISHSNGTQTLYSHLSSNIVLAGWHVAKGQVIGYIGSTGRSTGCHLHFEVRGAKNPF